MKKFLSVVFAVAMMFALAISASAKDVKSSAEFKNAFIDSSITDINLISNVSLQSCHGSGSKVINLNGHNLTFDLDSINNVCNTSSNSSLIFKNGTLTFTTSRRDCKGGYVNATNYLIFDNVKLTVNRNLSGGVVIEANTIIKYGNVSTSGSVYFRANTSIDNKVFDLKGGSFGILNNEIVSIKNGYTFEGWEANNLKSGSIGEAIAAYKSNGGVISAKYVVFPEIKLDLDEGTCDVDVIKVNADTLKPESIPIPTKVGFCFKGWFTSDGKQLTMDTIADGVTIYKAKWASEESEWSEVVKTLEEKGFSQDRINQLTSLFSSKNLTGSMFIGNAGSNFNGSQATIVTALVIAVVGIAAGVYCVKKKDE